MKSINHTGAKYGSVTGIEPTQDREHGQVVWKWRCSCGEVFYAAPSDFVRGKRVSCYTCSKLKKIASATTHGKAGTKEYRSWSAIKDRCLNPHCSAYSYYGGLGVTIEASIKDSFDAFLEEVGEMPKDGRRYTCGRIDNDKDYCVGNIRWETNEQQARNHSKRADNTSGVTGVYFCLVENAWKASYTTPQKVRKVKTYSVNKFGNELAFELACEWRENAIQELNALLGAEGYSEKHGK